MKFDFVPVKILNSDANLRILKILLRQNIRASERSMAKLAGSSPMTVHRAMRELGSINLVSMKKYGLSNIWEVNKGSYAFSVLKKLMPLIDFRNAALLHLKETIYNSLKGTKAESVILFGSVSKGGEKHDSDIDLYVLVKHASDKPALENILNKLSDKCASLYGNALAPYVIDKNEYTDISRKKLIAEIEKGIRII